MKFIEHVSKSRRGTTIIQNSLIAAAIVMAGDSFCGPALAQESTAADFPVIVHCTLLGVDRYFYLSKINANGIAVYISPDNLSAVITATGTPVRVSSEGSGTCAGKTVQELRDSGQAFDLKQ